jgi:CheY-like chemotaxis protein
MTGKILVADDSATIHKVVSLTFAQEDFAVESVLNGDQVLEKALEVKPDVILADVLMPGLNGYQVCERVRANPQLSHTPVLLMVGGFELFDKEEASRVGCDGHLRKPFDTSELIQMVHSTVERARKTRASDPLGADIPQSVGDREFPQLRIAMATYLASAKTKESFLGAKRILEVFGRLLIEAQELAATAQAAQQKAAPPDTADALHDTAEPPRVQTPASIADHTVELSDEALDAIARRLVQRMSNEVIREIAWEVVPELAEILIRQWLKEHTSADAALSATGTPADPPYQAR